MGDVQGTAERRKPVFGAERRNRILELLQANGTLSLRQLAEAVQSSEVTVRRDVRVLEAAGLLDRHHGGASLPGELSRETSYLQKTQIASAEKAAIADLAATLVEDGDAIVIGPGTTTLALAQRLTSHTDLTVVTNSLLVAQALAGSPRVVVEMSGGTLRGQVQALVGSAAERSFAGLRTRRAFLSGNGLTAARGLSTPNMQMASIDKALTEAAEEVVVLADHTKIGVDAMVQTVPVEHMDHLITGDEAPKEELQELGARGVRIHVART